MEIPPILALSIEGIEEEFGAKIFESDKNLSLKEFDSAPADTSKSKKAGKDSSKKDDLLYPVKDNKGREDSKYKNNIDLNDPSVKTYVEYNTETKMYEEYKEVAGKKTLLREMTRDEYMAESAKEERKRYFDQKSKNNNDDIENNLKIDITVITAKHQNNMVKGNKEFIHILNYVLELIDCLRSNHYV